MSIITLTSDFGTKDYTIAAVKGSLLDLIDNPNIIDISHEITPYSIPETAFVINAAYPKFPKNTIHIIGVDSEKTPDQRHLVAYINEHYFIAADNGIFSLIAKENQFDKIIEIQHPKSDKSSFPMLDVFVDIAAQIIFKEKLENLGNIVTDIKEWIVNKPNISNENELIGHIVYIDRYGNIVTDISKDYFNKFKANRRFEIIVSSAKITKIHSNYNSFINYELPIAQRQRAGNALAIFNSLELLEIALYKSDPQHGGSAATLLGLCVGDSIKVVFK